MYKAYGQTYISDDHFLSVVGAVAAVFNAGGRVFWGNLSDAYGYRYVTHSNIWFYLKCLEATETILPMGIYFEVKILWKLFSWHKKLIAFFEMLNHVFC